MTHIILISCHVSQSTNVSILFIYLFQFSLFAMGHLVGLSHKNIMKSSPPQVEITSFLHCFTLTLFYTAM
jgi:hypothetical protein